MPETEPTKVCPLCAETIKAAAKVCPYCRRSQRGIFFLSRYDLFAVFSCLAIIAAFSFGWHLWGTRRQFSPAQHKITVLSTQFGVERNGDRTNVVMSGMLTNASAYTWKLTGFEIRFFDASGKTVDAAHAGSEYLELTVLPHAERSFRLDLPFREIVPAHASFSVTVAEAKPPGFWLDSN